MQHKITHRIHSEEIHQVVGIQHIAFGFAHFAVPLQQPWMPENLLRKKLAQCHQENRPVNRMETDNVLPDQMQVCRPKLLILLTAVPAAVITDARNIIRQSIQPYIHYMLIVKIHRYPPLKGSPGYAQVLQPGQKEIVHHFVFAGNRLYKFRVGIDMLNQPIRIFTHFKEISFFLRRFHLPAAVRAFPVHQLGFRPERLAGRTIHTFIGTLINVPLLIQSLENFLYLPLMRFIRSTDKIIIRSIH